jgi:hypothetical protein
MAETLVIHALKRKHSEIAGELLRLTRELEQVEGSLRLFGYRGDFSDIPPKLRKPKRLFGRGELKRLVIDILRERRCPPFHADIAAEIIRVKGWRADDGLLHAQMVARVKGVRRGLKQRGARFQ